MKSDHNLIPQELLPSWFSYPDEFIAIVEQNLLDFDPWIIMEGETLVNKTNGLKQRYPKANLIPFAKREDNDDVACWEKGFSGVIIIHDFASSGYERREKHLHFWDWLRSALEETIQFHSY